MTRLYGAYGSNLCKRQMRLRCPGARPLGKFMLTSAQLTFRSVADLEFVPDAVTPIGLWSINRDDERVLDRFEGVGAGVYFKSDDVTIEYCGQPRKVLIYLMSSEAIFPPSRSYVETIRRGYRDFDIDERYLDEAIARAYEQKNPDEEILARRERQRASDTHRELAPVPASLLIKRMEKRAEEQEALAAAQIKEG